MLSRQKADGLDGKELYSPTIFASSVFVKSDQNIPPMLRKISLIAIKFPGKIRRRQHISKLNSAICQPPQIHKNNLIFSFFYCADFNCLKELIILQIFILDMGNSTTGCPFFIFGVLQLNINQPKLHKIVVKIYDQGRHKASWADNITESKCCIKTFKRILSHDGICKISKFKFSLTLQSPWFIVHYIQEETKIQKSC